MFTKIMIFNWFVSLLDVSANLAGPARCATSTSTTASATLAPTEASASTRWTTTLVFARPDSLERDVNTPSTIALLIRAKTEEHAQVR